MKKKVLISLAAMLAVALAGRAQAVISCDNTRVLYSGLDNPISVAVAGERADDVTVSLVEGDATLTRTKEPGRYMVRPTTNSKVIKLQVSTKKNKNVATEVFKVRAMPVPEVIVAGHSDDSYVSRKDLVEGAAIRVVRREGFIWDFKADDFKVLSTNVAIGPRELVGADRLTAEMAEMVRHADRGTKVYVTATVQMPDGTKRGAYCTLAIKDELNVELVPYTDENGHHLLDKYGRYLYVEEPIEEYYEEEDED